MAEAEARARVCKDSSPFEQPACLLSLTLIHKTMVAKTVTAKCQIPLCRWMAVRKRQRSGQGFRLDRIRYLQVMRKKGCRRHWKGETLRRCLCIGHHA